jgi:ATP-dependent RNA helicase DDX24/MAK5
MKIVDFHRKVAVIDLTGPRIVAENIKEYKIDCTTEDKVKKKKIGKIRVNFCQDLYLYYLLLKNEGKKIVFVNSITCIKRLR